ncbi:MAG: nitrate ABC transporter substrate-binding protein, partial [Verrucomicrobiota bacterium]
WFLTQMIRWGQITEMKPDSWFDEMAKKIYRPDIYMKAVEELIDDGEFEKDDFAAAYEAFETGGYKPPTDEFIDGNPYDAKKPNDYIKSFEIGLK